MVARAPLSRFGVWERVHKVAGHLQKAVDGHLYGAFLLAGGRRPGGWHVTGVLVGIEKKEVTGIPGRMWSRGVGVSLGGGSPQVCCLLWLTYRF
jgi:hypothetical protein